MQISILGSIVSSASASHRKRYAQIPKNPIEESSETGSPAKLKNPNSLLEVLPESPFFSLLETNSGTARVNAAHPHPSGSQSGIRRA